MERVTTEPRTLTATALGRLLAALDPDPAQAAREYERLHRALARFFEWRGAGPAEECADEAIDRLCRKLDAGTVIDDLRAYARGIARMVLHERQRAPSLLPIEEATAVAAEAEPTDEAAERRHRCFDRCLEALPADNRALVLDYYKGDRADKIANRRRLAAAASLSENALRSRVQRVRDRLERCVRDCLEAREQDR
jgi:DNA-directed RNA polymerase specialized sigma24 family protein